MLPDFPKIKSRLEQSGINDLREMEDEIQKDSILSLMPTVNLFEGDKSSSEDNKGNIQIQEMIKYEKEIVIKKEEAINGGLEVYKIKSRDALTALKKEQEKDMIKTFSEAASGVGNVIKSTKKDPLEKILEMIEKIDMDFDENGNPHPLALIVFDKNFKKELKRRIVNPEIRKKSEQIMEKKRMEWRDRESNRKLVD